jgi:putative peptidoglycan lipid II flippase
MSTVLLPHFATLVANHQWEGLRRDLGVYTRLILVVSAPATLLLALFSRPVVALLFQRGAFTAADTATVSLIQSLFVLQIPFYMLGIMLVRVVSAFKANQILMWGTAISTVVNVVFNYWLMSFLGVAGIALSTSVVYVVAFGYLSIMVSRLMKAHTDTAPALVAPVAAAPGI